MTRAFLLSTASLAVAGALALAPVSVLAADAANPYGNIDHRNDAGNNTGDSQVDQLNAAQLDQNYWPRHRPMPSSPPPAYQAAPSYAPPPPPYAPPPRPYGY